MENQNCIQYGHVITKIWVNHFGLFVLEIPELEKLCRANKPMRKVQGERANRPTRKG